MLKAIVSYSKKVPVPDADFSSQGFSLSLETEVTESDPAAIQARLHQTFELVKASVEQELAQSKGAPAQQQDHRPNPSSQPLQRNNGGSEKASNKQIKFVTDLATQRGIALSEINADVQRKYGVGGLYDLTRKQASELLDELNGKRKAA
jgi:hypothetical protein